MEAERAGVVAGLIDITDRIGAGLHEDRVLTCVGGGTGWRFDGRQLRLRLRASPALEHSGRVPVPDALAMTGVKRHLEHAGDRPSSRAEAHVKLTPPVEVVVEVTDARRTPLRFGHRTMAEDEPS